MRIELKLYTQSKSDPLVSALRRAARRFTAIPLVEVAGPEDMIVPCLEVVRGAAVNIRYAAAPEGLEAAPFDEMMDMLSRQTECDGGGGSVSLPASLQVFVSPTCVNCPSAVRAALYVAMRDPAVDVTIIDAHHFPDAAQALFVQAVPTVVVDGAVKLVGVLDADTLLVRLSERGRGRYRERQLEQYIEDGRFDDAATAIAENAGGAFVSLWNHSTLQTRIGLMVAAQTVLERTPEGLHDLVPGLVAALESVDAALRGDTVDLLGHIGNPVAAPEILALVGDENPDVAEIAAEVWSALAPSGASTQ